ncbi:hypothetical protein NUU61_000987 [Penicillium alfredii]|uniref:PEBP-like protein n=1 Tax=Penicillium alfredii TaxID=1506179 RepID=A0A9W9KRK3_9EURO|nr:uncharacterized protein NUU61_000987 [Penicillium alfredii]KAJ5115228.1 hypothetical protein NUU61_000987 [Penicillium alfredii]
MKYVEYGFSRLFANAKGRDAKLFSKGPAFSQFSNPTIDIECPEVGASGSQLHEDHSADGAGHFPTLRWPAVVASSAEIKQYLLISEDPDAPLPNPIIHGIYYGIAPTVTEVTAEDFVEVESGGPHALHGGWKYGQNRKGTVYIPPRPLLGHGPHRYFFTLVALTQPLDVSKMSPLPTAEEVLQGIEGNVAGWGQWIGVYERVWK